MQIICCMWSSTHVLLVLKLWIRSWGIINPFVCSNSLDYEKDFFGLNQWFIFWPGKAHLDSLWLKRCTCNRISSWKSATSGLTVFKGLSVSAQEPMLCRESGCRCISHLLCCCSSSCECGFISACKLNHLIIFSAGFFEGLNISASGFCHYLESCQKQPGLKSGLNFRLLQTHNCLPKCFGTKWLPQSLAQAL